MKSYYQSNLERFEEAHKAGRFVNPGSFPKVTLPDTTGQQFSQHIRSAADWSSPPSRLMKGDIKHAVIEMPRI
jgi:hypothetical protein